MVIKDEQFFLAQEYVRDGRWKDALHVLRRIASYEEDYSCQSRYAQFAKKNTGSLVSLPVIRVAFLAGSTIDHFVGVLRFWLLLEGFRLESYIAPFNTWRQASLDKSSELYAFKPDVIWFFTTRRDINFPKEHQNDKDHSCRVVNNAVKTVIDIVTVAAETASAVVFINNMEADNSRIFGNFEAAVGWSQAGLTRRYNLALSETLPEGAVLFDLDYLASRFGLDRWNDERLWMHSKHAFSLDAMGIVAHCAARQLSALRGRAKKCLILDLDNTLWGGVVGDDGVNGIVFGADGGAVGAAYLSFQRYVKDLNDRGIILAICSKNDEKNAREAFLSRPDMPLQWNDFAAFRINWGNKADNIRSIAEDINLGLDSFVFIDDNPSERALVRQELPEVVVLDMPHDPSEYVRTLAHGSWFEMISFSKEDQSRALAYRQNEERGKLQSSCADLDSYLKNLHMKACWKPLDKNTLQRAVQLVNKTNQFNLTTIRYSYAEMDAMIDNPAIWAGCFSLKDCFGDHGLISVVILRFFEGTAVIDTWVMSCRVFSRGMEDFVFATILKEVCDRKCCWLEGVYIPTEKNSVVSELYKKLGGQAVDLVDGKWRFDLANVVPVFPDTISFA